MADRDASETSPLLGESPTIAPKDGNPSHGLSTASNDAGGSVSGRSKPPIDEENHEEISRDAQFKGLPEVKQKLKYILPAIMIGLFLSAADQTIIVSSYGKIGNELNALNKTSWISTSYFLTLSSFQPLYGKLSDIYGRKAALLFAYAVFGTGCLFCGLARNIDELIAARAFAGIGGGGMTTVASIIMSDIVPLRERGTWQGILNIVFASGAGFGAPLGGLLADSIGWRWAFLAQFPLCAVAFLTTTLVLKLPRVESSTWKTKFRRVDFLGAVVLICGLFMFLLGLDRGSNLSWRAPITIASLCISPFLMAIFIFVEQKVAAEPFAPGRIIFDRSLFSSYLCNFFSFAGWISTIFFLPLFFQAVDGFTASQSGVRLLPGIVAGVGGSLFAGYLMQKTGKYYWITVIAFALQAAGMVPVLLFTGLVTNNTYGISLGLVMCGFGSGIGITTTLIALIANAAPEDQAIATAGSYLFRSLGSVVGISLSATVIQQTLRSTLRERLTSGEDVERIMEGVRQSLDYLKLLKPETREIVKGCYEVATRNGFGILLGIPCLALLSSFFISEKTLSKR